MNAGLATTLPAGAGVHLTHDASKASKYFDFLPPATHVWRLALPWAIAIPVLAVLPYLFGGTLGLSVISQICIAVTFAVAYNLLLGGTGLLSFGHSLYFGVGAYTTAHVLNLAGESVPLIVLPIAGAIAAMALGGVLALFTVRKARVAFSMISLAVGQLAYTLATVSKGFSGGDSGIRIDPTTAISWGIDFGSPRAMYFLVAGWAWVAVLAMFLLLRTPLGKLMSATRDNASRLEFLGFSPVLVRGLALTMSAGFAGIAGALYALQFQVVTLDTLGLPQATIVLLQTYIGGYTSFMGSIVGAILLTLASANLSALSDAWPFYTYSASMLAVMFLPRGLIGWTTDALGRWRADLARSAWPRAVVPRLLGAACATLMLCGYIGLVEMVQSLSANDGRPVLVSLLGPDTVSPHRLASWVGAAVLLLVGIWGLRGLRRGSAESQPGYAGGDH
jgi:branched-chain amino acid transport system permease protein